MGSKSSFCEGFLYTLVSYRLELCGVEIRSDLNPLRTFEGQWRNNPTSFRLVAEVIGLIILWFRSTCYR
jgi:hypothetical protein